MMAKQKKYKIKYTIKLEEKLTDFLKNLPKVPADEVDILYETDIYDGPLEGLCIWNRNKYYFSVIEELRLEKKTRAYFLIKLTDEQLSNEESLHNFFVKYVESYPYVRHGITSYRKDADWNKYQEICETYPDQTITKNQIVAWFER